MRPAKVGPIPFNDSNVSESAVLSSIIACCFFAGYAAGASSIWGLFAMAVASLVFSVG